MWRFFIEEGTTGIDDLQDTREFDQEGQKQRVELLNWVRQTEMKPTIRIKQPIDRDRRDLRLVILFASAGLRIALRL
jgi:hypothetical protein